MENEKGGIQPEETELPDNVLGNSFSIQFSADDIIEVIPLFDITDHPITITDGLVSGRYSSNLGIVIKTVKDYIKYTFTKFSDIPKGHNVYHFITSNKKKFVFQYKIISGSDEKIYTHNVYTDWTALSKDFRSYKWQA